MELPYHYEDDNFACRALYDYVVSVIGADRVHALVSHLLWSRCDESEGLTLVGVERLGGDACLGGELSLSTVAFEGREYEVVHFAQSFPTHPESTWTRGEEVVLSFRPVGGGIPYRYGLDNFACEAVYEHVVSVIGRDSKRVHALVKNLLWSRGTKSEGLMRGSTTDLGHDMFRTVVIVDDVEHEVVHTAQSFPTGGVWTRVEEVVLSFRPLATPETGKESEAC